MIRSELEFYQQGRARITRFTTTFLSLCRLANRIRITRKYSITRCSIRLNSKEVGLHVSFPICFTSEFTKVRMKHLLACLLTNIGHSNSTFQFLFSNANLQSKFYHYDHDLCIFHAERSPSKWIYLRLSRVKSIFSTSQKYHKTLRKK